MPKFRFREKEVDVQRCAEMYQGRVVNQTERPPPLLQVSPTKLLGGGAKMATGSLTCRQEDLR